MELGNTGDKKTSELAQVVTREDVAREDGSSSVLAPSAETYRLYKRRWVGLVALVSCQLL